MTTVDGRSLIVNPSEVTPYRLGSSFGDCVLACVEEAPLIDRYRCLRIPSKAGAAAIAVLSKLPFIPVAMQYGLVLGPPIAVSNTITFSVLRYWAAQGMIDDALPPKTQAQIDLAKKKKYSTCAVVTTVVVIPVALLLALGSQTDTVLPAMLYNPGMLKVAAAIVSLLGGIWLPLRSFQLSLSHLSLFLQRSAEARVTAIKTKMIKLLLRSQKEFIRNKPDKKEAFIQTLRSITDDPAHDPISTASHYVSLLTDDSNPARNRTQRIVEGIFRWSGIGAGLILAGVFEWTTTEYAYVETRRQVVDNPYVAGTVATVTAASTLYLFATSIVKTTARIFSTAGRAISLQETRSLSWQLRPKLSFALTATGLLTGLLSAGIDLIIFGDFYKDSNPFVREFLRDTTTLAIFLLLFTATLDTIDDIVTHSIKRGSPEEQQILALSRKFEQLARLVEQSPSREFIEYITSMDDQSRGLLRDRVGISAGQLIEIADQLEIDHGLVLPDPL